MTSGVPQGTVLGPLLFLLDINNLHETLGSSVKVFADDALLYGVITNDADCDLLQDDLQKLEQWQNQWQMQFNPSKCKVLCISKKRSPPVMKYTFCGVELEQVENITCLGITLTSKLKWDQHKASKVLCVVRRNFHNCPRSVRETAYKSDLPLNMELLHGIPITRRNFKSWREFRERQRDSARATCFNEMF